MIRVMVIGEVDLLRGALAALLSQEDDIEVVSATGSERTALATARRSRPDVVVIDVDHSNQEALELTAGISAAAPSSRILIITANPTVDALQRALDANALGFLGRDVTPGHVTDAIRDVAAGRRVIDSDLATMILSYVDCPLTSRELEVLRVAAEGIPSGEIAERISLAPGTVRNYLSTIIRKTGASNRTDAIRRAQKAGWL